MLKIFHHFCILATKMMEIGALNPFLFIESDFIIKIC